MNLWQENVLEPVLVHTERSPSACLKVWETAKAETKYVLAVNGALGIADGDASVIEIFAMGVNAEPDRQVVEWSGHMLPRTLAGFVRDLGVLYNEALVVCEYQHVGITIGDILVEGEYPNLYTEHRRFGEKLFHFVTTVKTRPQMDDTMARKLSGESPSVIIRSAELAQQLEGDKHGYMATVAKMAVLCADKQKKGALNG